MIIKLLSHLQGCIFAQNMKFLPLPFFQNIFFPTSTVKFSSIFLFLPLFLPFPLNKSSYFQTIKSKQHEYLLSLYDFIQNIFDKVCANINKKKKHIFYPSNLNQIFLPKIKIYPPPIITKSSRFQMIMSYYTSSLQTIDLLYTRPAITQRTGSISEEEIYSQFGFLLVELLIYRTRRTKFALQFPHSYRVYYSVPKFEGN